VPINNQTLEQIKNAGGILGKVLSDLQGAVPTGSTAGFAIGSASILLPTVINLIISAVEAAEAHQAAQPTAQPIAS
jgi:hypothetical protein